MINLLDANCGSKYQYIFTRVLLTDTYKQNKSNFVLVANLSVSSQTNVVGGLGAL